MTSERTRAFLGVYAPLILGAVVIALGVNFYAFTSGSPGERWPAGYSWEAWRSVCTGGLVFIGAVLCLSTWGRYRKAKAARAEARPSPLDSPPGPHP